ncbi:MAG: orotidine-5'-phosphate decarboxylase [Methanomicrobiales archaeon]|nr:orotidine-5'-phosphate decarboxylase [Methanomicrobiales archaeon]
MTELILALDVTDRDRALGIAHVCAPFLDAIKIGYPLVLFAGLEIAQELSSLGLPLIADFKIADIPYTNRLICEEVFGAGFHAVIAHGFPGSDSLRACVDSAHAHDGACYVVAEMSHPGAVEFFPEVADRITFLAMEVGADGIIAPATRPERIRELRKIVGNRKIYSPGIGAQGGDWEKASSFADGIIVGRTIYESSDPAEAARQFSCIRR